MMYFKHSQYDDTHQSYCIQHRIRIFHLHCYQCKYIEMRGSLKDPYLNRDVWEAGYLQTAIGTCMPIFTATYHSSWDTYVQ